MLIINIIYICLGFISMGLGILGVVLPILPTTDFILLSVVLFGRGSDKFDNWFKGTKVYKYYAQDFIKDRFMTLKRKITIFLFADFMIAFPLIVTDMIWLKIFLIIVVIFKYHYFIFRIKTKKLPN